MSVVTERPELAPTTLEPRAHGPLAEASAVAASDAASAIGRAASHLSTLAAAHPLVSAPAALLALLGLAVIAGAVPTPPARPRRRSQTRARKRAHRKPPRSRTRAAPGEKGGATKKPANPPVPARA